MVSNGVVQVIVHWEALEWSCYHGMRLEQSVGHIMGMLLQVDRSGTMSWIYKDAAAIRSDWIIGLEVICHIGSD